MIAESLQKHFDIALDTPDGIEKLRGLILTLAMQGKLVPQQINDQPVKLDNADVSHEGNLEHRPKNWQFGTLGQTTNLITKGTTPTSYGHAFQTSGIPFVKVENVKNGSIQRTNKMQFISSETHEMQKRSQLMADDILFSIAGTIGETCIVKAEDLPANINQALAIIRGYGGYFMPGFLIRALNSSVSEKIKDRARGAAMYNISLGDIKDMVIPLPPLAEQKRIVAKIDQLMALCDKLEAERKARDEKRITVHTAAVNRLLSASDKPAFDGAWQFITKHFAELYAVQPNVAELRKAILQLAVMGKLVPQDPNDQPASKLLEQIEARVAESGPYPAPQGWVWVKLADVGETQTGTTPPTKDSANYGDFMPFIGPGNIKNYEIDYSGEGLSKIGLTRGRLIKANSILMVCIGGSIGKHAITDRDLACNQQINTITPAPQIVSKYVFYAMASSTFQQEVITRATGSATPIINKQKWSSIPFPLPPPRRAAAHRRQDRPAHGALRCAGKADRRGDGEEDGDFERGVGHPAGYAGGGLGENEFVYYNVLRGIRPPFR